jgi:hypothetical protein
LGKPLDINIFKRDKFLSGKLSFETDEDDSQKITVTLLLDPGHIMLVFPMVGELPAHFPSTVSGTVLGFTKKSNDPEVMPINWDV